MQQPITVRIFALFIALIAWFSILFQLRLSTGSVANFFSYFTIVSNLLVAVSLTSAGLFPCSAAGLFFQKLSVQSAIALYIFIVGLVYNLILRGIWQPTGWGLLLDNLLHVVVPVLYLLYWAFFRSPGTLRRQDGWVWLVFPAVYFFYSLLRGALVDWYPYPFLDARTLGYGKVALNSVAMLLAFLAAGWGLIFLNRVIKTKTAAA